VSLLLSSVTELTIPNPTPFGTAVPDGDTPSNQPCPDASLFRGAAPDQGAIHVLDEALFGPPFVLIDAQGRCVRTARSITEAHELLESRSRVAAIVGTLVNGVWAVDVDPTDNGGDAVLGEAAAELVVAWATQHCLRWWVRESGRPGGRHVIIEVPDAQLDALRQRVVQLAETLTVPMSVRKPLRLLGSPHRLGLPAPNIGGTLIADYQHSPTAAVGERRAGQPGKKSAQQPDEDRDTRTVIACGSGQGDTSPSGVEYGRSMFCARSGYTAAQAWRDAVDCQVTRRGGYDEWLRFIWSKAITVVAAESGLSEEQAWVRVERETPQRASELGRDRWRSKVWQPALAEATIDRPRRYTDPRTPGNPDGGGQTAARQDEIAILREGLRTAAEQLLSKQRRRPQVHHTMAALMDTLALAIAHDGRISLRRMAEESLLADSTVELRCREALQAGLITKVATYRADCQPCDLYAIGPVAQPYIQAIRETRGSLVHPQCSPRTTGAADPSLLRAAHATDRRSYLSPALTPAQGDTLSALSPDHRQHFSCVIRSRAKQLQWWRNLSDDQKVQRRRLCRSKLDRMSSDDRQKWLDWLTRRDLVDQSINRILAGVARTGDRELIESAPMTLYHGQRDPLWRVGGTLPPRRAALDPLQKLAQGELDLHLASAVYPRRC
jgi:hypothetical protein